MEKENKVRRHASWFVAALWLAACALLISSCATRKNSEYKLRSDYRSEEAGISSLMEELRADIEERIDIVSEKISNMKLENKTIYFSIPDSMGKQYPTRVSETSAGKEDKERTESTSVHSADIRMLIARIDSISGKVDSLVGKEVKEAGLSWWELHKDKVYAGAILLLFAFLITVKLKKGG